MDSVLKSSFLLSLPFPAKPSRKKPPPPSLSKPRILIRSSVTPDPWSLSDGNDPTKPKPKSKNAKNVLSDDNARRIIKAKAKYLSVLRRNQGSHAMTPKWIKRTPEQMVQYLADDRNGQLYGKHVVAAIKTVRSLSEKHDGEYDIRVVMGGFVGKLTFREMCVVLKEQKGWRQVRDFFAWMKLQLCYRPSVIVYTIILRIYGQIGKLKLAEQIFLEMLEAGCEPDEVACGTMLCTYARWGRHKAMLSFHSAVQERGIILSVAVYNFMLSSLQKKSLHKEVIEIWRQMVDKGVAPNKFAYTLIINSLVKEGHQEEAFKTFNEMRNVGFVPEEIAYSLLISVNTRKGKWNETLRLYENMRSRGIVPSNYTCASLLTMFYKHGDYCRALSLFAEMTNNKIAADEVIYGLLIRIYGKLGLYEDAQRTFEEIGRLGLLSDEKTYLAMAQVHLSSGNYEKALDIVQSMKSRKIWFSRFAYIVLLQCYIMKEDLDFAEVTFQALSKTGLPDAGCCSDMLNLYVRLDLRERAKNFIVHILKEQVEFDDELCKAVMGIYCKEGMIKEAEQFIEKMGSNASLEKNKFIKTCLTSMHGEHTGYGKPENKLLVFNEPDITALSVMLGLYMANNNFNKTRDIMQLFLGTAGGLLSLNQLISKFIREGSTSKAEALSDQLIILGLRPEDEVIASLINLYGKQQDLKQAKKVFATFADLHTSGKVIFYSMIDAYFKCGEPEEACSLFHELTDKGHDLGAVSVSKLVNTLTNSGKHKDAEGIIYKSFQNGLELDTVAYNTFIKAMLVAGRLHFAESIYERMLSMKVSPSIQTYNTMISIYGRARKLDKAIDIFNMAQCSDVSLDEKAYMNLIGYYGKAGKIREAFVLFSKMKEEGIKPGMVSYNIMVNVYATAGMYHEVERLLCEMKKDGLPPDSFTYLALIQAYASNMKYLETEEIIYSMQKQGIIPTSAHINKVLCAFTKAGLMKEAERIHRDLLTVGLGPDLACHRTMLRGYMEHACVEEGISFFEGIRQSAERDKYIMSAAVHLYKFAGKECEAEGVLDSMNTFGIPFLKNLEVGLEKKVS